MFAKIQVEHLPMSISDHFPLLVHFEISAERSRSSFHFQNMWIRHHTFLPEIRRILADSTGFQGMMNLQLKLKRVKMFLKTWNREVFGNVVTTLRDAEVVIAAAQAAYEASPLTRAESNRCVAEFMLQSRIEGDF